MAICVYQHFNTTIRNGGDSLESCRGFILLQPSDYLELQEMKTQIEQQTNITNSYLLPPLSIQDAGMIGGAIVTTWAIAFGFVLVVRMLLNKS